MYPDAMVRTSLWALAEAKAPLSHMGKAMSGRYESEGRCQRRSFHCSAKRSKWNCGVRETSQSGTCEEAGLHHSTTLAQYPSLNVWLPSDSRRNCESLAFEPTRNPLLVFFRLFRPHMCHTFSLDATHSPTVFREPFRP